MNDTLPRDVAAWAGAAGWDKAEQVRGGTNNRLYRMEGDRGFAALKIYYRGANDPRDRFGAEQDFYDICARGRRGDVPARMDSDTHLGVALFEWVDGSPVQLPVSGEDLASAASFLREVNAIGPGSSGGSRCASEACFDAVSHFALLDRRLDALEHGVQGQEELSAFVCGDLARLRRALGAGLLNSASNTASSERLLSPGDFGFHNALRRSRGDLVFFDFEYSGWDDPVKTVADVFLQPEKPVDFALLPEFCAALSRDSALPDRVRRWMPFFVLKWCCILLNPAVSQHAERRKFSGDGAGEEALAKQLGKARLMLARAEQIP